MTDEKLKALADHIAAHHGADILKSEIVFGELVLTVRRESLLRCAAFLKSDPACQFQQLVDVCGADYPERAERFDVVYCFLSLKHNHRVRLKVMTDETVPVESLTALYPAAGWFEREAWDLYGVHFDNSPDHRRILTDYGFEGHPLRKDFPLTGFVEIRYDEEKKTIVQEQVKLTQAYRNFDFVSPWEGMTTMQEAGAEKGRKPKVGAT